MKKSIIIVDDHVLIAEALAGILNQFDEFRVIYKCKNGKELIEKLGENQLVPDIILLDINMPVLDGFETTAWLNANHPNILVMVLSMRDDEESVLKIIKNGANAYLLKDTNPLELKTAITELVENGFYYPSWVSKIVYRNLGKKESKQENHLYFTDREREFLKFSVTEMTYKEIGEKMCCSSRTVESYRDSLFEKLNLKSRVGLAIYALKNGFDDSI